MSNKRGIELSMNFIVILIISIFIFGFGVRFIYTLSSKATELQGLTLGELDDRIGNLICEGSDRVCVGQDKKTIQRGKFDVFGLKIINVLENKKDFKIELSPPSTTLLGYKKDKTEINIPPAIPLIILPQSRTVSMETNEERNFGIGIEVPPNAVPGTYIFNIRITDQASGDEYVKVQKLYVDVP